VILLSAPGPPHGQAPLQQTADVQSGIFTGNRELTGLLPAVDLLSVDTDAAVLRARLKGLFD